MSEIEKYNWEKLVRYWREQYEQVDAELLSLRLRAELEQMEKERDEAVKPDFSFSSGSMTAAVESENPPPSDSGARPPVVDFMVDEDDDSVMTASPPGATIRCSLIDVGDKQGSLVTIMDRAGGHIAHVTVLLGNSDEDLTTETILVSCAIYWSWWRAEDMKGRTHL
jgi:hypothetical protein